MRSHAIRRRKTRSLSVTIPRTERRDRADVRVTPFRRYSEASRSATRVRSRTLTTPVVEVPALTFPSLSRVHVLPQVDSFARRIPRTQVLSGQALSRPVVGPTVDLKALYYARPDVMVCVRRKQRKEVLFATGRAGGNHKKPRFTEESKYICY